MERLAFDSLRMEKLVLEVRYEPALMIWDRAGTVGSRIKSRWPSFKIMQSEPAVQAFAINNRFEVRVSLDRSAVMDTQAKKGEVPDFVEMSKYVVELLIEQLRVDEFTRIGFRPSFVRRCKSAREAAGLFMTTGAIRVPDSYQGGSEFSVVLRSDTESIGRRAQLATRSRKEEVSPPLGSSIEATKELFEEIVFDLDYYTKATVKASNFSVETWVDQGLRQASEDARRILDGEK